ncbi:hypothetical protein FALCPG4_012701 [Fusarium falciforme]
MSTNQQAIDQAQDVIEKRGQLENVKPDVVCLDGHRFHALFWQDEEVKYEDIPEELKAYEVKDEQPDDQDGGTK